VGAVERLREMEVRAEEAEARIEELRGELVEARCEIVDANMRADAAERERDRIGMVLLDELLE